jgi:hypothetical protein
MATGPCPRCKDRMKIVTGQDFAVCPHCRSAYRVDVKDGRAQLAHIGFVVHESAVEAAQQARQPPQRSRQLPRRNLLVLAIMIAIIVVVAVVLQLRRPYTESEAGALRASREFVEYRLVAPASAEWCGADDSIVYEMADSPDHWYVWSCVDSQNRAGALLRMDCRAELRYKGGGDWELISLTTDD